MHCDTYCIPYIVLGYPTLLYFHKNTFTPVEYKGTRDLPSLTIFLSEVFTMKSEVCYLLCFIDKLFSIHEQRYFLFLFIFNMIKIPMYCVNFFLLLLLHHEIF